MLLLPAHARTTLGEIQNLVFDVISRKGHVAKTLLSGSSFGDLVSPFCLTHLRNCCTVQFQFVFAPDGTVVLGKAHTRSIPSHRSLSKGVLETVPMFVRLNTDRSRSVCIASSPYLYRLIGLVVRCPPRERMIPGSNPACAGIFFGVESYQWLKNWHSSGYPARRLAF